MAAIEEPTPSMVDEQRNSSLFDEATPWIEYAVQQAKIAQRTVEESVDLFVNESRSRLARFTETGSAHLQQIVPMVARADSKVNALKQYIDLLKAEGEKLEKSAMLAEEEIRRGQTKLRQAGTQIQGVIRSANKIERRTTGLKDLCGELPSREASKFKSQVSKLASEAEREKNALTKEVARISNYGISV